MHGVCHIEIPTTDSQKSKDFYVKIFGWQCEDQGGYMMWRAEGVGGGFTKESAPVQGGVVLYIEVEDIEKKLAEIVEAGGKKITDKEKISDEWGYVALFSDPFSNTLGLWSKQ